MSACHPPWTNLQGTVVTPIALGSRSGRDNSFQHDDRTGGRSYGGYDDEGSGGPYDAETESQLDEWVELKRNRDFEAADKLREELRNRGIDTAVERPPPGKGGRKGGKGKGKRGRDREPATEADLDADMDVSAPRLLPCAPARLLCVTVTLFCRTTSNSVMGGQ